MIRSNEGAFNGGEYSEAPYRFTYTTRAVDHKAEHLKDVTLAVLAGGTGSRMGRPKGELTVRGVPILPYLLEQFAWPGPTLLVTAPGRERPPGWERFNREAVDAVEGEGPLRGVLTAIDHAASSIVVVVTVDMPGIKMPQVYWLLRQLQVGTSGVMMTRANQRIEPFPLAVRRTAASMVADALQRGERSVWRLSLAAGFSLVDAPSEWPLSTWINLNSPADYQAFQDEMR
jgi:molybdopterin-guanine dinucleotide biosynthesis protein A